MDKIRTLNDFGNKPSEQKNTSNTGMEDKTQKFLSENELSKKEPVNENDAEAKLESSNLFLTLGATNKEDALKELYKKISNCKRCDLSKTKKNYVFGAGSPNAKIIFVGEAPGFWEDQKGEPFVGRAGKFLDTLLEHIGLKREDVYIANILKRRPPENRDPTLNEIKACTPFLDELMNIIKPKIIAALGRHSMGYLFDKFNIKKEGISKIHGEHFTIENNQAKFFLIALYHPAVALYNPNMRDILKKDFEKIKELLT